MIDVRHLSWSMIAVSAGMLALGCSDATTQSDKGANTGGDGAPADDGGGGGDGGDAGQPGQPGARCGCDTDCAGDNPICFLGMCAERATASCTHGGQEGCAEGLRCVNSDIVPDGGVCFPLYNAETCALVENRDGLCSPTRADGCDPACGSACVARTTEDGTAGAACDVDAQCTFHADDACYSDSGGTEPNGWVEGYCLAFGCTTDAECGDASKGCFPAASDGSGVCMSACQMDLDCRWGYACSRPEEAGRAMCFAGCDNAALCPDGYECSGSICIDSNLSCGPDNHDGLCPDGSWCDEGVCNDTSFSCDGREDSLEPNDARANAVDLPEGVTQSLYSCGGNEDWYKVTVPAGKIARVGIEFNNPAGDLDLVAYDSRGSLVGSRLGAVYPYSSREQETDTEYYGFYSQSGTAVYYVRALGAGNAENVYSLHLDYFDYKDGESCEGAGYSFEACTGAGKLGSGLIPFPYPDPNDTYVPGGYLWDTYANYRFARREMVMLMRHALHKTYEAFPGTKPLGIIDVCQKDGVTPGYDVGSPRHPESTHDQGGNIDIAYFQTDGNNSAEIICGDGAQHADGFCSPEATEKHFVDLPRQAYFMAQLFANRRTRVIGVDQVIAPLLLDAAKELNALDASHPHHITNAQLSKFNSGMAYGSGWPFHHHHIHLSMNWWTTQSGGSSNADGAAGSEGHQMMHPDTARRFSPAERERTIHNMSMPPTMSVR